MYICKECGNYYQFTGNASVILINKIYATGGSYRAEVEEELDGVKDVYCTECGGDIVDIDIKTLPERLKEEVYNTLTMDCVDEDIMKSLKVIVNK